MRKRAQRDLGKGCYVLLLRLSRRRAVTVGRLGRFDFPAGWYSYVGSALGPGGLGARLQRHVAGGGRRHWHVDFLRAAARVDQVWAAAPECPCEHDWARVLGSLPGLDVIVPRFGASDCRCSSHLFFSSRPPSLPEFRRRLRARFPDDPVVSIVRTSPTGLG